MRIKDDAKVAKMTFAKVEPDDADEPSEAEFGEDTQMVENTHEGVDGQVTEAEFGEGTQGIENVHEGVDGQAIDGQATEAENGAEA
jgi:hypothetical protein